MSRAGELIRRARLDAGLTQAGLARRLGTTQSAVARMEAAGANPRLGTIERVMEATGNTLHIEGRPKPPDVDDTLIAHQLRLTPAQRLASFEASQHRLVRMLSRATRLE